MLGEEWVVDARGCDADALRDPVRLRGLVAHLLDAMRLTPAVPPLEHRFGGEAGITILVLLTESHLAIHTFPEVGALTLNVYCCKPRTPIDWRATLARHVGASGASVRTLVRGADR